MTNKEEFEEVYQKPGAIWTMKNPPKILKDLVETGFIKPSKSLDIACGEGFYSIYLAEHGFDVTGIDFSERALKYARENVIKSKQNIKLINLDVNNISSLGERFDFILEWGLLHHLNDVELKTYLSQLPNVMNTNSLYLSASFNQNSEVYGKRGQRYRETPLGTKLCYRSPEELKKLFAPNFEILREEIIQLEGRGVSQPGNLVLLRKMSLS